MTAAVPPSFSFNHHHHHPSAINFHNSLYATINLKPDAGSRSKITRGTSNYDKEPQIEERALTLAGSRICSKLTEKKLEMPNTIRHPATYVPKCKCEKADEEYKNLLRGAPKPDTRLRCKIHVRLSYSILWIEFTHVYRSAGALQLVAVAEETPDP